MPADHVSAFWHPFADMSAVAGHDLVIASGQGSTVTAEDGRSFLDATAALWYCNVGHGREEIGAAVARQMSQLASYSNFGDFATRPTLMTYTAKRADLVASANALFKMVESGKVKIEINQTYPLSKVADAHRDLEARKTTGSTVLLPG